MCSTTGTTKHRELRGSGNWLRDGNAKQLDENTLTVWLLRLKPNVLLAPLSYEISIVHLSVPRTLRGAGGGGRPR